MREFPSITSRELRRRVARIKPVLRFAYGEGGPFLHPQGFLHFLVGVDPRHTPLIEGVEPKSRAEGLVCVATIDTYHTFSVYRLFRPSIAEVLAQIPAELIDTVTAFEVPVGVTNVRKVPGFHIARTTLYRAAA